MKPFAPPATPDLDVDPFVVLGVCLRALRSASWCTFDVGLDNPLRLPAQGAYASGDALQAYLSRYLEARRRP